MKKSLPHDSYEALADFYAAIIDRKPHNAYYEKPATQSLVGDVSHKTILDAGCGPGVYTEWLLDHGANVVAIDSSEKMIAHAKKRIGNKANFVHANLEEPLSFLQDSSFDGILSTLAITYVRDHTVLFSEFNRILRNNGWFIFSTEHPFFSYRYFKIDNYFETKQVSCDWVGFEKTVRMKSYYHSLGSIMNALSKNKFIIEKIVEPKPTKEFKDADPDHFNELMQFPLFICVAARKNE